MWNDEVPSQRTTRGSASSCLGCGAAGRSNDSTKPSSAGGGDEQPLSSNAVMSLRSRCKRFITFCGPWRWTLQKALDAILAANPYDSVISPAGPQAADFYCVTQQRPYPVILGTLVGPPDGSQGVHPLFPVEATPIYTGVRDYEVVSGVLRTDPSRVPIGGGYIESFAYDSYEPKGIRADGYTRVQLKGELKRGHLRFNRRYRFTLSDVIGMSGAAPAVSIEQLNIPLTRLFPGYRHWSVARESIAEAGALYPAALELTHGDGGDVDNMAASPLLARRVENILVFVNPDQPFNEADHEAPCRGIDVKDLKDDLIAYFRDTTAAHARDFLKGPFPKHMAALGGGAERG